ncbi:Threonine/homoserine/homoserine lactone efflux protein [Jannaschia faecimaris]|uniref:Threonine/homoserine/homoserine lactone efflux protein n=1 Tax=Jannaschia faecimaris TaxID=1244108 RepID=A0A1H3SCH2_9RHOB|nr:LysE family translocator [Jannaschia faecimaris]SDZ35407.1 Threonine/homoserine/homoserine lactone efflux protein [Jannaschia faecimaris]
MTTLTIGQLVAFNVALFFAVAAPGPAFLICTRSSLQDGVRAGVMTGLGLAIVAGLWTLAALLGLDALFDAVPQAYTVMKIGGAILVLFFAVGTWLSAAAPVPDTPQGSSGRAFLQGVALNLANPKSIIFAVGVLLVIFPPGLNAIEMGILTVNHILLEAIVYSTLAYLLNRPNVRARYIALKPRIMRTMAIILALLGLRLLLWG